MNRHCVFLCSIALLLLFYIFTVHAADEEKTFLILPFENTGSVEYDKLRDLIPTYFYALLKDIPGYTSVSLYKVKHYEEGYFYKMNSPDKENLMPLVKAYNAQFIIRGEFRDYDGELIVYLVIVRIVDWDTDSKILKKKIRIPITYTLDELFLPVIDELTGFIIDSTILAVTPDKICSIFVDGDYYGESPMRIRLLKGTHFLELRHKNTEGDEAVYKSDVLLRDDEYTILDIKVNIPLTIKAEQGCKVYIDNEYKGVTPLAMDLYTGKDYHIRVIYPDPGKGDIVAYDSVISTKELAYTEETSIEISLPALSSIHITESRYDLACRFDTTDIVSLPHSFLNLKPDTYTVEIIFKDDLWNRDWIFYRRQHTLVPYENVQIDMQPFHYRKQYYLCLIPSLPQFHNFQRNKGIAVLSAFSGSCLLTGVSALLGYFYEQKYRDTEQAVIMGSGSYTEADVVAAKRAVYTCNIFITAGVISVIVVYVYSGLDGFIAMNHLDTLLNGRD